jgi:uncharacterized peroxidase-related enzyme
MGYMTTGAFKMVEEDEAEGEVAEIYTFIRREMGLPYVPNSAKTLAVSPAALKIFCDITQSYNTNTTLPQSLISMILYTVAKTGDCKYCSATNELACRTLGIDQEALDTLVDDLPNFSPQRVRVIIEFALKVAHDRKNVVKEDYDKVRAQGISDAEIVEIAVIAAIGVMNDTLSDALHIEVDHQTVEALGG